MGHGDVLLTEGEERAKPRLVIGPMTPVALAAVAGVTLGYWVAWFWVWVGVMGMALLGYGFAWRRGSAGLKYWGWLAVVGWFAAYLVLRTGYTSAHDLRGYVLDEPQLAVVEGVVHGAVRHRAASPGPFSGFDYRPPVTLTRLRVDRLWVDSEARAVQGELLLRLKRMDHRLVAGQRLKAEGWLQGFGEPKNPGEFDYAAWFDREGVAGQLTLSGRENWEGLGTVQAGLAQPGVQPLAEPAGEALRRGVKDRDALALLERLLLGQRTVAEGQGLEDEYRRVGLAHVLSISGAHLSILLGMVWALGRLVTRSPRGAAVLVLVVLGLYLMAVPWRVPIVRASVMAVVFALGFGSGRKVGGLEMLSWSAVLVLLWRPGELLSPGFQLSFGVVAGLLVYVPMWEETVWPRDLVGRGPTTGEVGLRYGLGLVLVSAVAFAVALPLTAYHFGLISPLAVLLSVLAFFPLAAVLGVGFVKVFVGMVLPSVSVALAGPSEWLGGTLNGLVRSAGGWPGVAVELGRPVSAWWAALVMGWVVLALTPKHWQRWRGRVGLVLGGIVLLGWLGLWGGRWPEGSDGPGAPVKEGWVLDAIAVGDGTCYVLRLPGRTVVYDCGSAAYLNVGSASVVPAMRWLGVDRVDDLVLSHADLDHYSGVPDVLEAFPVERVWVTRQMLAEVETSPATAYLFEQIEAQGLPVRVVARGWTLESGGTEVRALWPESSGVGERSNEMSLVLRVEGAGRVLLLNGDIEEQGKRALMAMEGEALRADVTDLPHHGAWNDASAEWLQAVGPSVVVQSSSDRPTRRARWAEAIEAVGCDWWLTAESGMVEVRADRAGIRVRSLRPE